MELFVPQTTCKTNEENQPYVVTVKLQGRIWIISSACTSTLQLQLIDVISDWVSLKHESKPVINQPRWGHYLNYGVVRPNLARRNNSTVAKRTHCSSTASSPFSFSFACIILLCSYKQGFLQSIFSEWEVNPPTSWIAWTLKSLALSLVRVQLDWTLHKVNKGGSIHDQKQIGLACYLI